MSLNSYKFEAGKIADRALASPGGPYIAAAEILAGRGTKGARAALITGLVVGALVERGRPEVAEAITIELGQVVERGARRRHGPYGQRIVYATGSEPLAFISQRQGAWGCVRPDGTPVDWTFAGVPHQLCGRVVLELRKCVGMMDVIGVLIAHGCNPNHYTIVDSYADS